jgi:hypothetical protein
MERKKWIPIFKTLSTCDYDPSLPREIMNNTNLYSFWNGGFQSKMLKGISYIFLLWFHDTPSSHAVYIISPDICVNLIPWFVFPGFMKWQLFNISTILSESYAMVLLQSKMFSIHFHIKTLITWFVLQSGLIFLLWYDFCVFLKMNICTVYGQY